MKALENNPIDQYLRATLDTETAIGEQVTWTFPFPSICFSEDDVSWPLIGAPLVVDEENLNRYSTYSDGNDGYFIYKRTELGSPEPLYQVVATYIGRRIGVSIAQSAMMLSRNYQGNFILGKVSHCPSMKMKPL